MEKETKMTSELGKTCENCKTCETCAHFVQHYGKAKKRYYWVAWGHCTTPLIKPRPTDQKACGYYEERVCE